MAESTLRFPDFREHLRAKDFAVRTVEASGGTDVA